MGGRLLCVLEVLVALANCLYVRRVAASGFAMLVRKRKCLCAFE